MTRVNLNDGTITQPLSERDRHTQIIRELAEERDGLRAQLSAATARAEAAEARMRAVMQLPDKWRARGMYMTNIRALPGPAPESVTYYECASTLEAAARRDSPPQKKPTDEGGRGGDAGGVVKESP